MGNVMASAGEAVAVRERPLKVPAGSGFGFGGGTRVRRRAPAPGGKTNEELISEYLAVNQVKVGPPRFADGSVKASGTYEF